MVTEPPIIYLHPRVIGVSTPALLQSNYQYVYNDPLLFARINSSAMGDTMLIHIKGK